MFNWNLDYPNLVLLEFIKGYIFMITIIALIITMCVKMDMDKKF